MGEMLYLECASGISGDMAVAALLDLGASEQKLQEALASLPLDGFETRVSRVKKSALDACDFAVILDEAHENYDHDMRYLHGSDEEALRIQGDGHLHDHEGHSHHHENESPHSHDNHCHADAGYSHVHDDCCHEHHAHHDCHELHEHHDCHEHHEHHGYQEHEHHEHCHEHHGHQEHEHHHEHRGMAEIETIIKEATLTPHAREVALNIFSLIAQAEAKAHGVPVDQVHFHEVGAVDSIVDVVAFAVCFDDLGIDDVVVERLCEGQGTVRCQHGVLPVPVPAVINIVSSAHIPLSIMNAQGEFVTPTGAAIAAAVRTRDTLPSCFTVKRVGLGAGKREYAQASVLRAMIIEEGKDSAHISQHDCRVSSGESHIWRLETEVDDCTGEALGYVMDRLYTCGAREAHFVPVFMKKNRPAYQIQIICTEDLIPAMEAELFAHTTTIGIRRIPMERTALPREAIQVETSLGVVRAKKVILPDGTQRVYPENDDVVALCESSQGELSYQDAYRQVLADFLEDKLSCD